MSFDKFYYPKCKINNCDGILRFKINNNFTIDYQCDKNQEHKGNIKTFERFFLKEEKIKKCSKCNTFLENNYKLKCKICNKIYCCSCFKDDEHIKVNINDLKINSQKCQTHNIKLFLYCINCKKNLCQSCLNNNSNNPHKKHIIKNLIDLIPSNNNIENIINRLKYYDELIDKINKWQQELIKKIDNLKQNILNEKEIINCFKFIQKWN